MSGLEIRAETWDKLLGEAYPKTYKDLQRGCQKLTLRIPMEIKDEAKEREFKGIVTNDAAAVADSLSKKGKWGIYKDTFKGAYTGLRLMMYFTAGVVIAADLLMGPTGISLVTIPFIEGGNYVASYWTNKKSVEELRNLEHNISICYSKKL